MPTSPLRFQRRTTIVRHPALAALCAKTRETDGYGPAYCRLIEQIGVFLAIEATREIATRPYRIDVGELGVYQGVKIDECVALVPILRAGLGLLRPFQDLLQNSCTWPIKIHRDDDHQAIYESSNIPNELPSNVRTVIVLDPMLATGNSAVMALDYVKLLKPERIIFVGVLGCDKGINNIHDHHPDVDIILPEVAPGLNANAYLLEGPGDVGDNLFNTNKPKH